MGTTFMTWLEPFRAAQPVEQTPASRDTASGLGQYAFCAEEVLDKARHKSDSAFLLEYAPALIAYVSDPAVSAFWFSRGRDGRAA